MWCCFRGFVASGSFQCRKQLPNRFQISNAASNVKRGLALHVFQLHAGNEVFRRYGVQLEENIQDFVFFLCVKLCSHVEACVSLLVCIAYLEFVF